MHCDRLSSLAVPIWQKQVSREGKMMKIALYIEDGLEQIVLTPETETEKSILGKLHDNDRELAIHKGEFYPCRGGWTRMRKPVSGLYNINTGDDGGSSIIVLREKEADE